MEPKIKKTKELVIKAKESEEAISKTIDDENAEEMTFEERRQANIASMYGLTDRVIPKTPKQVKARAANKRAKKARKINRK